MGIHKWMGSVPDEWPTAALWILGKRTNDKNDGLKEKNLLSLSYGNVIRKDIKDKTGLTPASYETYQIVEPGDVIFRFTDLQNDHRSLRSALVTERGIITSAYINFRPDSSKVSPDFIAYFMRAMDQAKVFYEMGTGVRQTLNYEEFSRLEIPLPPLPTQRAIADYLDRETAEIDGMRADLDEMERLLEERRTVLIQRLINQRIDADATPMSIAIQGHVGGSGLVGGQTSAGHDETGILKTSAISSGRFSPAQNRLIDPGQVENVPIEHFVKSGDLLFNRLNSPEYVGAMSYVGEVNSSLIFSDKIWRLLLGPQTDPKYLAMWSKTPAYRKQVEFSIVGTSHSMQSLGYSTFQKFRIFLPPLAEQRRIADEIDRETAEIDSMLEDITKLRDLLVERRAAVISAAVTGQIDIPASLDDKDEPHD